MPHPLLTDILGIEVPVIGGAMYPCSNIELIAAVSEGGGIGVIQPLTLAYVYRLDFRNALRRLRALTQKPIGMNVIVEKSSKIYERRMRNWVKIALEEDVRFFITALGDPSWVVQMVKPRGGLVYHDVTEKKWAVRALDRGAQGLICVNNRAGGHAGRQTSQQLFDELNPLGVPLVCAGGIANDDGFAKALKMGYAGVQMGTRFIATPECGSHSSYKQAIVDAEEKDIVLTDRISGVPVSVIRTPYVERIGTRAGPLARFLLRGPRTKHWMRFLYSVRSLWKLKRSSLKGLSSKDYWQAGKSVADIHSVEPVSEIMAQLKARFQKTAPLARQTTI